MRCSLRSSLGTRTEHAREPGETVMKLTGRPLAPRPERSLERICATPADERMSLARVVTPDGGVVHLQVAADRADDDLAGADPDVDRHAGPPPRVLGIAAAASCMRSAA